MRTTLRGSPMVAAPGKVFLVGEYSVLEGGIAVLAAVNRLAVAEFIPALDPSSPLVAEAVRATLAALGDKAAALPAGSVRVDTSAFVANDANDANDPDDSHQDRKLGQRRKLGLGSSAATAACTVGAVLEMAGLPIATHRELAFSVAESAHRTWQGGVGSGADVAVAVHGGVVQYSRPGGGAPIVRRLPHGLPGLELVVFAARAATSTTNQVRAMRAFAERSPAAYAPLLAAVRDAAERFVEALAAAHALHAIAAMRNAGNCLAALGEAADVPIVTPPFQRAAGIAAELGGAAKPSGAGGGDIGVALFADRPSADSFRRRLGHPNPTTGADASGAADSAREAAGALDILDLAIDDNGLHRRNAGIARIEHHV